MEEYLSIGALAQWWHIPKSSVYELTRKRKIEIVRIGKHIRIPRSSAERYLSERFRPRTHNGEEFNQN